VQFILQEAARFLSADFSPISVHPQQLVMHEPDNYNAQDHHRPSEAVVQSCLFVPLANLLRVMDMNEAGFASSSLQFPDCQ